MKIIEVENLTKTFKKGVGTEKIIALDNISFSLKKGNVLGVIGPNGSGKTTLFKCLLGFIKPDHGKVTLFENLYKGMSLKSKIGFLYEKVNFYPELTSLELLEFYGKLYHIPKKILIHKLDEILNLVGLEKFKNMKVSGFSKGMIQRLGIAMTLINDSELLIFDELISGLDPYGTSKISKIIEELIQRGKTLVISSHVLSHIEDLCNEILILFDGRILRSGNLNDFITNYNLFRIELKLNNQDDGHKAVDLLKKSGFDIGQSSYSNQDLEKIFIDLIEQSK